MIKPQARILDATAGLRTIWKQKTSAHILWVDIETDLETPPDVLMDCTNTNFEEKRFHTIFFDPPHGWGKKPGLSQTAMRNRKDYENYPWKPPNWGPYYGWDKYKNKQSLLIFIHKAQKEFHRILQDDGVLWLKWNECNIPLSRVLPFFKDWVEMMRIEVGSRRQTIGKTQTYWLLFMKNFVVEKEG